MPWLLIGIAGWFGGNPAYVGFAVVGVADVLLGQLCREIPKQIYVTMVTAVALGTLPAERWLLSVILVTAASVLAIRYSGPVEAFLGLDEDEDEDEDEYEELQRDRPREPQHGPAREPERAPEDDPAPPPLG